MNNCLRVKNGYQRIWHLLACIYSQGLTVTRWYFTSACKTVHRLTDCKNAKLESMTLLRVLCHANDNIRLDLLQLV